MTEIQILFAYILIRGKDTITKSKKLIKLTSTEIQKLPMEATGSLTYLSPYCNSLRHMIELFGCRALRNTAFFLAGLGFFLMTRPSAKDIMIVAVLVRLCKEMSWH